MKTTTIILGTAIIASGSFFGHNLYMNNQTQQTIDEFVSEINTQGNETVVHGDYGYNLSQQVYINDLKLVDSQNNTLVELGDVLIKDIDLKNEVPRHMSVSFSGIKYDLNHFQQALDGEAPELVNILKKAAKGDHVMTNAEFSYKYSPENKNSFSLSLSEEMINVLSVDMNFNVDNLNLLAMEENKATYEANPFAIFQELGKTQIREISFDVSDKQITQLFLEEVVESASSSMEFKSVSDVESFIEKQIENEKANNPKLSNEMYNEIVKVIKNKKGFSFSVKPEPMPVMDLFMNLQMNPNPEEALKLLNVNFKAK